MLVLHLSPATNSVFGAFVHTSTSNISTFITLFNIIFTAEIGSTHDYRFLAFMMIKDADHIELLFD